MLEFKTLIACLPHFLLVISTFTGRKKNNMKPGVFYTNASILGSVVHKTCSHYNIKLESWHKGFWYLVSSHRGGKTYKQYFKHS